MFDTRAACRGWSSDFPNDSRRDLRVTQPRTFPSRLPNVTEITPFPPLHRVGFVQVIGSRFVAPWLSSIRSRSDRCSGVFEKQRDVTRLHVFYLFVFEKTRRDYTPFTFNISANATTIAKNEFFLFSELKKLTIIVLQYR